MKNREYIYAILSLAILFIPIGVVYELQAQKDGRYLIINERSGRSLDADVKTIHKNGTLTHLWKSFPSSTNQHWEFQSVGNNKYIIRNVRSGRCLDADYKTMKDNGTLVHLWKCFPNAPNQQWYLKNSGNGRFILLSADSKRALDADVKTIQQNGTLVHLWDHHQGAENQQWRLIPVKNNSMAYGIDISRNNGNINWKNVKSYGKHKIQFVYVKATEGSSHVDNKYKYNFSQAQKNNYLVGSYHFFRTLSSPYTQFKNFVKHVDKNKQDLLPMIDIEEKSYWSTKTFHKNLKIFLNLVEKHYGKKPIIYTYNSFYNTYFAGKYKEYKFFIARYNPKSPVMRDNHNWTLWQFTRRGKIQGIRGYVDINRLNPKCTLSELYF